MTRRIKELSPTIVDAIQAMIDGLEQLPNDDFKVDMSVFGRAYGNTCYGCAATFTLMKIAGEKLDEDHIDEVNERARCLNIDYSDLYDFEDAIDDFRKGQPGELISFYDCDLPVKFEYSQKWNMLDDNYKDEIPKVKAYLEELKSYLDN